MGSLVGLAPWVLYWVLVGNVPLATAVLVALAVAIAAVVYRRHILEIGGVATFVVLAILTFATSQSTMERWALPLSNAGIFLVALVSGLIRKPFMREVSEAARPAEASQSEPLDRLTAMLTWMWVAMFAAMTVSSSIPPIVRGGATMVDRTQPLSFVCYWVIPFALLTTAGFASRLLADRMHTAVDNVARKTTFVAYDEATIDELYYLAQQHANREVGTGKEAYDVKVGGMGTPLVGDDSRKSWPATYKVRERV